MYCELMVPLQLKILCFHGIFSIGGSRGACQVHAPLWDPFLLFSHTFSPKSAHVVGPRPPTGTRPPMGNPGSATVSG